LLEAIDVLKDVEGLAFSYFDDSDVVRHHLVQRIVRAYDERRAKSGAEQLSLLESKGPLDRTGPSGPPGVAPELQVELETEE